MKQEYEVHKKMSGVNGTYNYSLESGPYTNKRLAYKIRNTLIGRKYKQPLNYVVQRKNLKRKEK